MQFLRSKLFDLVLVVWTVGLGLATPVLMLMNSRTAVRFYSRLWAKGVAAAIWHVIGLKHRIIGELPRAGEARLIVSNHQSMWETIIFATLVKDVAFVAKQELRKIPIFGWYMKKMPMVLIDRSGRRAALVDMLRQASEAVSEGRSVLIFPEGTRTLPDEQRKFHSGVAALYGHLKIPAVIVAHNSGCFWNPEYLMKYNGTITLKVIEEIPPGLPPKQFLERIETSINENKNKLKDELRADEWRWAVG